MTKKNDKLTGPSSYLSSWLSQVKNLIMPPNKVENLNRITKIYDARMLLLKALLQMAMAMADFSKLSCEKKTYYHWQLEMPIQEKRSMLRRCLSQDLILLKNNIKMMKVSYSVLQMKGSSRDRKITLISSKPWDCDSFNMSFSFRSCIDKEK